MATRNNAAMKRLPSPVRASGDARGAFDVARYGGSAGQRAKHGPDGIGHECAAGAGEFALTQKTAALANANKRSDVVEEIHEEKYEGEVGEADFRGGAQVELRKSAGRMRQRKEVRRPTTQA